VLDVVDGIRPDRIAVAVGAAVPAALDTEVFVPPEDLRTLAEPSGGGVEIVFHEVSNIKPTRFPSLDAMPTCQCIYNFNISEMSAAVRSIVSTCSRFSATSHSTRSTARA